MSGFEDSGRRRPFFTAPGDAGDRPRLLLISYHFPPGKSAGSLRWQKLAPLAYERGWALDVVAADPEELLGVDWERMSELPPGTRVWGARQPKVLSDRFDRGVTRLMRWTRTGARPSDASAGTRPGSVSPRPRSESVPPEEIRWSLRDPRSLKRAYNAGILFLRERGWAHAAESIARQIVDPEVHVAVITCGPPHLAHEAGRAVAAAAALPLIIDLRDPWSIRRRLPADFASPLAFQLASRFERRVVSRAALVVANTDAVREELRQAYPYARAEMLTIMNGYDEEGLPPEVPTNRFLIAYAGGIYLDRNPRLLFRAAARVIRELDLQPDQFGLELIGNVDTYGGVPTRIMALEEGIGDFVATGPARPRAEALAFLRRATMLVSLPQDSPWAIPSKIFEYMNYRAWILALSEPNGPVGALLRGTDADVVAPDDVEGLTQVLRTRYLQHLAGERPPMLSVNTRFSRRAQADLLFRSMERHIGSAARRASGGEHSSRRAAS